MSAGRYRLIGGVVPLAHDRGVSDTYQAQAALFLKKSPAVMPPYFVAAEFVCAELARQIRLPVPPSFIAELPGEEERPAFACLGFNLLGGTTPPINPAEAVAAEPDLCTGVLVFDAWIVNTDRHPKNVSFQALRVPHRLNVFDHSHALFFYPDALTHFRERLGITGDRGNRHCLLDALTTADYLHRWVERVERVPETMIHEILCDAVELGLPAELAEATARFLVDRRNGLGTLIEANRNEFRGIVEWPLL